MAKREKTIAQARSKTAEMIKPERVLSTCICRLSEPVFQMIRSATTRPAKINATGHQRGPGEGFLGADSAMLGRRLANLARLAKLCINRFELNPRMEKVKRHIIC